MEEVSTKTNILIVIFALEETIALCGRNCFTSLELISSSLKYFRNFNIFP